MASHVEEAIRARIQRVKHQKAARRLQREELNENRQYGLNARRAAKLRRRQAEEGAE